MTDDEHAQAFFDGIMFVLDGPDYIRPLTYLARGLRDAAIAELAVRAALEARETACARGDCDRCARRPEWYMLRDEVWAAATIEGERFLCLACVERRIGRRLGLEDFTSWPVNDLLWFGAALGNKIRSRR